MSAQLDLVIKVYSENKDNIAKLIIKTADAVLVDPKSYIDGRWSQYAYTAIFNDGIFDPFWDTNNTNGTEYFNLVEQSGNESDETMYISAVWCYVLIKADPVKYASIITHILDISVNGL